MADLTVRDVDEELVRRLEVQAARHNRSVEEEHRAILEQALSAEDDFWRAADELRRLSGPQTTDSTDLIRRDRDERSRT